MILRWLSEDLESAFASDRRARGVLWFDARRDFELLLSSIAEEMERKGKKLFRLDYGKGHGPMWLKWQMDVGPASDAPVLVWLPFSQDALFELREGPNLRPLIELLYRSKTWLIDGRAPTLFSFLGKHGVPLPAKRAERVQLWKGGPNSSLAKYVKANLARDEAFWLSKLLSPEIVEQSLVGDPAERLLQLFADPSGAWAEIQEAELEVEFVALVASEFFAIEGLADDPARWVEQTVSSLILLEIWEATGKAEDYPFQTKLPKSQQSEAARLLLQKWMKDRDHFESFRRWSLQIGQSVDLSSWIAGREGRPQGLRKLVEQRWEDFYEALKELTSIDDIRSFLSSHGPVIAAEGDAFWGRVEEGGVAGWDLARRLLRLSEEIDEVLSSLETVEGAAGFVDLYSHEWHRIDLMHWKLLADVRRTPRCEKLADIADRFYLRYVDECSSGFYKSFREDEVWPPTGCRSVAKIAEGLWKGNNTKKAVLVVDALRFDLAAHLVERLAQGDLDAVVAHVPSVTWVGMTALLGSVDSELHIHAGKAKLIRKDTAENLGDLAKRWNLLSHEGVQHLPSRGQGRGDRLEDLLDLAEKPRTLPSPLALFSRDVDALGHGAGAGAIHHFASLLEDLERAILKLQLWGYQEIHVVTDHGFLILHGEQDVPKMFMDDSKLALLGDRYGFVKPGFAVEVATVPFCLDPSWNVAVPPGIRSFRSPGAFFHGGATLQEVVVPHLVIKAEVPAQRPTVEVLLPQTDVATLTVKVMLQVVQPEVPSLFDSGGTPLRVRVFLGALDEARSNEQEVKLIPGRNDLESVTVFLKRDPPIMAGDELEVQVIDMDTGESYSRALKVRAIRDLG